MVQNVLEDKLCGFISGVANRLFVSTLMVMIEVKAGHNSHVIWFIHDTPDGHQQRIHNPHKLYWSPYVA